MELNKMETAPKCGEIVVYAMWAWYNSTEGDDHFSWRVCEWDEYSQSYVSTTSNPYQDEAHSPAWWSPLPLLPGQPK